MSRRPANVEFRFGLGHIGLDYLATLGGRLGDPVERLREPCDLDGWFRQAGLEVNGRCDDRLLVEARALREAIYRLIAAGRNGGRPLAGDLELLNRWARMPVLAPQIGRRFARVWAADDPPGSALAHVA